MVDDIWADLNWTRLQEKTWTKLGKRGRKDGSTKIIGWMTYMLGG